MSAQGLRLRNGALELTLSTDAVGLVCIGKMTLQGSVVQPSGTATLDTPGRVAGYSKYRINSPTPIVVAIDLPESRRAGVISVLQVSTGVWEATCYCGDTPDANNIDTVQYQIAVWAFAVSTKYGARGTLLRNPATGQVAYDLSQPYPLFPRAAGVNLASPQTIASLTRPVILGAPADDFSAHGLASGTNNTYIFTYVLGTWRRTGGTLTSENIIRQRYQYNATEPRDGSNGDIYNRCAYFLIEGALLP